MESGVLRVTLSNNGATQPIIERKGETATLLMSQKRPFSGQLKQGNICSINDRFRNENRIDLIDENFRN